MKAVREHKLVREPEEFTYEIKDNFDILLKNSDIEYLINCPFTYTNQWLRLGILHFHDLRITINRFDVTFSKKDKIYIIERKHCLRAFQSIAAKSKNFRNKTKRLNILVLGSSGSGKTTWSISVAQKRERKKLLLKLVDCQYKNCTYKIYDLHDNGCAPWEHHTLLSQNVMFDAILLFDIKDEEQDKKLNKLSYKRVIRVHNIRDNVPSPDIGSFDISVNAREREDSLRVLDMILPIVQ